MMCPGSSMWFFTGMTPTAHARNRLATGLRVKSLAVISPGFVAKRTKTTA